MIPLEVLNLLVHLEAYIKRQYRDFTGLLVRSLGGRLYKVLNCNMMCSVGDDEVSVNMSRFKKELESALGSSDMFAEFSHDPSAYDLDISDSDMDYGKLQKTVFSDFSCCNF